jgi:hypothetical protein
MVAIMKNPRTMKQIGFELKVHLCGYMYNFQIQVLRYLRFSICLFLTVVGSAETVWAYTKSSDFAVIGDWKISSESGGGYWCRATGQINEYEIQILAGDLTPRYVPFAVVVRTPKKTEQFLPVNFRTTAKLLINGEYFAAGEIISSGDVIGGKSSAHYARATFAKINDGVAKLRTAHKLTLIAENNKIAPQEIGLQDMEQVIGVLQECKETRGNKDIRRHRYRLNHR